MVAADYLINYPKFAVTLGRLYRADFGDKRRDEVRNSVCVGATSANVRTETIKVETTTVRRQVIKVKRAEECSRRRH